MPRKLPVSALVSAAFAVFASFLPWVELQLAFEPHRAFNIFPLAASETVDVAVTAWKSSLTAFGVLLPNWLLGITAVTLVGFALLTRFDLWAVPRWLTRVLFGYAFLHLLLSLILISRNGDHLGIGWLLTTLCFVALALQLRAQWQAHREAA
jgi:hypothetical protein